MTDSRSTFARFVRRSVVAALAIGILVSLTSCTPPTPSIAVSLAPATVELLRGGSVDVVVHLTRLGGAVDPVTLSLAGAPVPAHVTAAFDPPMLWGAALESTLTLAASAAASEDALVLTVAATTGTLSGEADLDVTVTSLSVTGTVMGPFAMPISGVLVQTQGQVTATNGAGVFQLDGLTIPYDLTLSQAGSEPWMHVFEGMRTPSPVIAPVRLLLSPPATSVASLSGAVLGGAAVGANEVVAVCVEGLDLAVLGCDHVIAPDTAYGINATWFSAANQSVKVHALHYERDASGVPTAVLGYHTFVTTLADGGAVAADLDLAPVASRPVSATISAAGGYSLTGSQGAVRLGPNLALGMFDASGVTSLDLPLPDLPGASYVLAAAGLTSGGIGVGWWTGVDGDVGTLVIPPHPQPVTPLAGAVGVTTTTFTAVSGNGGPMTFVWEPTVATDPTFARTTMADDVTIPDPTTAGLTVPSGASYEWRVDGSAEADVDAAARFGLATVVAGSAMVGSGGPGFLEPGAYTRSAERSFDWAP